MASLRASSRWARPISQTWKRWLSSTRARPDEITEKATSGLLNSLDRLDRHTGAARGPSMPQRMVEETMNSKRYKQERARKTMESAALQQRREDFQNEQWRPFKEGDVYAPHDLSSAEQRKWSKFAKVSGPKTPEQREARKVDMVDLLKINPVLEYKNFAIMSEYISPTGKILHSNRTGLRPKNQRKMAKAIRRARSMGLLPSVHKHPLILNPDHQDINR